MHPQGVFVHLAAKAGLAQDLRPPNIVSGRGAQESKIR